MRERYHLVRMLCSSIKGWVRFRPWSKKIWKGSLGNWEVNSKSVFFLILTSIFSTLNAEHHLNVLIHDWKFTLFCFEKGEFFVLLAFFKFLTVRFLSFIFKFKFLALYLDCILIFLFRLLHWEYHVQLIIKFFLCHVYSLSGISICFQFI